jgi:hypothetical protein
MRFQDPFDVVCAKCGKSVAVPVADLLALNATCFHCGALLSEVGEKMRRMIDEVDVQYLFMEAIIGLEEEFSVPIPDQIAGDLMEGVTTKAGFVNAFVPYLAQRVGAIANVVTVSSVLDRSLARIGYSIPSPESTISRELLRLEAVRGKG